MGLLKSVPSREESLIHVDETAIKVEAGYSFSGIFGFV